MDKNACSLQIRLFGMFESLLDGKRMEGVNSRPNSQRLLALLCLHPDQDVSNEYAASQIWPVTSSIDSLRQEVPALRRELGAEGERLVTSRGSLRLNLAGADVDTCAFDSAWEERELCAAALQRAVERYRGPLLQGWYDDWISPFRSAYQAKYLKALRWLTKHDVAVGELQEARDNLQLLVQAGDPASLLHQSLVVAYLHERNFAEAKKLYEDYRGYLLDEHHMAPSEQMTALYKAIPRVPAFAAKFSTADLDSEPSTGVVPLDSPYYIARSADALFHAAIARHDSIILLRGPRQGGKTSLLARGLEQARQAGSRVVVTDFVKLGLDEIVTHDALFLALAHRMRRAFAIETSPEETWDPLLSANANFESYLRDELLTKSGGHVVWGIDEADHIFDRPYRDDVFGLFRSWHNERSLDPGGPWQRFSLILTYSTEAHLYIANLHQSPFNVGTKVVLDDFTPEQVSELNTRYGGPLSVGDELNRLTALVGGHPYLVRRCLSEAKERGWDMTRLETEAAREGGLFADHLARLWESVSRDAGLAAEIKGLLEGRPGMSQESFSRLRAAGVIRGETVQEARLRCGLYAGFLQRHLA